MRAGRAKSFGSHLKDQGYLGRVCMGKKIGVTSAVSPISILNPCKQEIEHLSVTNLPQVVQLAMVLLISKLMHVT